MDRMKELAELLNNAAYAYYQKDQELMTDREYDALYDELLALEKETGLILSNSPTQQVGYEVVSNLKKVNHAQRILSLDKTKDIEKLKDWLGDEEGVLSWKLDGLTIVLQYKDGALFQAVTRGNGEIGEDVTHNAKVFQNVPLKIPYTKDLLVRGEAVISFSMFEKINASLEGDNLYKNPRNLCSGTVRQLNAEICKKRNVIFYAFHTDTVEEGFQDLKSNQLSWLSKQGFDTVEYAVVSKDNLENQVQSFSKRADKNDFATDGLVLIYNRISYGRSLGATSKFPRDSMAFKWKDEMAETTLRDITWNTSRTGLINPVAVFDPVELEGTSVKQASVHNVSILEELQLGVGDTIKVYKANMIIPQIAENLTKSGNAKIPEVCPVCGFETEIRKLREGKALYCANPNCHAQLVKSLSHFASRDAMNIEGFSEETVKKFVDKGFIEDFSDLFSLHRFEEEIKTMEGFGEKSYQNLVQSLEKAKTVQLPNFIYALGINHVGLSNAKLLCRHYQYDLDAILEAGEEDLSAIEGFGEVIAHSLHHYFHDAKNLAIMKKVLDFLTVEKPAAQENSAGLAGMTFVITGDLEEYENRKALQDVIESMGGKVSGSVSSKTSYLINNDTKSASSKNKKAQELGIPIISEKDFISTILNK